MMLRWIVSNWVRQMARNKVHDSFAQTTRAASPRSGHNEEPDASVDHTPCRILVVFAMAVEAGGMLDLLQSVVSTQGPTFLEHCGILGERRVALIESGIGRELAGRATADAISVHRPEWIISAGFAGALSAELKRGHILMASHLVDLAGHKLDVGLQMDSEYLARNPALHAGRLLTVNELVRTPAEKKKLAEQHDAVACDMETTAVAEVCCREKVRFLSVRIISDSVDDELPQEIEKLLDQKSLAAKLGAATGAILGRPSSVKDMWGLREEAIRASDRLAKFLTGVIGNL